MKRLSKLRRQPPTLLNLRRPTLRKPMRRLKPRPRQTRRQRTPKLPKTGKLTPDSGSAEPRQIASRSSL
nr:MAG TPA: hypothetical protein [Caudoviricetes sp.]DAV40339.1 MAG TPA: hypothetical protein [Caudoviricetes sp.]